MYFPSDPAYQAAKSIRQGATALDPVYDRFVSRFRDTFGFAPLMVRADTLERVGGRTWPRLQITLERTEQMLAFDPAKERQVAGLLVDSMAGGSLRRLFGMPRSTPLSYPWREEIFVGLTAFEPVAKREAIESPTGDEVDAWVASLGLGERLWLFERSMRTVVFVQTDAQADELRQSDLPGQWGDRYFELARRYDEFGYLGREDVTIEVDSRQNFEENYQSNWYYYFK